MYVTILIILLLLIDVLIFRASGTTGFKFILSAVINIAIVGIVLLFMSGVTRPKLTSPASVVALAYLILILYLGISTLDKNYEYSYPGIFSGGLTLFVFTLPWSLVSEFIKNDLFKWIFYFLSGGVNTILIYAIVSAISRLFR